MTLGRSLALALLTAQAQWSLDHEQNSRAKWAARRFAALGVDCVLDDLHYQDAQGLLA
jgi:hypothetical protein